MALVPGGADLLVLAGKVGNASDNSLAATQEEQYERALRNIVAILASQGGQPANSSS